LVQNISQEKNQKQYHLHFDIEMAGRIQVFCDSFHIEVNHFVVKTIESRLNFIAEEIEDREYDFVLKYFDLSKLDGSHIIENTQEAKNRNNIIEAKFPPLTSTVIENIRKIIPWALGNCLEDIIINSVDYLFEKIKKGEYDFLDTYLDFLTLRESIEHLDDEELKKERNRVSQNKEGKYN